MVIASDTAALQPDYLWALIVGAILSFLLGFGMGANDVSNAFGTSVGSRTLTLTRAYILATIVETMGAILVGYRVADTMRKEIVNVDVYANDTLELFLGQVAILGGGAAWLIIATALKAPVSTTHSVVGATLGFTLVAKGNHGINWGKIGSIAISWVASPLFSGLISSSLYVLVDHLVLRKSDPVKAGLRALPFFYFACIAFNAFTVLHNGSELIHLNNLPWYVVVAVSLGLGLLTGLIFHFFLSGKLLEWINESKETKRKVQYDNTAVVIQGAEKSESNLSTISIPQNLSTDQLNGRPKQRFDTNPRTFFKWLLPDRKRDQDPKILRMFSAIQVFTACFAGFAHGANDVSNAIAPLSALIALYQTQSEALAMQKPTDLYVIVYGVFATCVGLWCLGHFVIRTVGKEMSEINPASGFTIEFGAAMTALLASKAGLPISTTHCLVGSVVAVGTVRSRAGVDWAIFRNIALSWAVTLPASGLISAAIMFALKSWAV